MKTIAWIIVALSCLCISSCDASKKNRSQDEIEILNLRQASNDALKTYDVEKELSLMTDDVFITTGNGTLLQGKNNLREFITTVPVVNMYWVRTPVEIEINEEKGIAWEHGKWKGYQPGKEPELINSGNYAAMWVKLDGWKIKSELFVSLDK